MQKTKQSYIHLFLNLLKTDLIIYKETILNGMLDSIIWAGSTIVLFAYIFPHIGMSHTFAPFIAVGVIVSCAYWDVWTTSTTFIADMEGNKTITYYLSLPLPNTLVFIKQILGYACKASIPAFIILPLSKLFLWNQLSFVHFSSIKFAVIFIIIAIFVGSFSLFVTSMIKNMHHVGEISIRFLFPLWFFGGSHFSWQTLFTISPKLGYLVLLNPLVYAMEGIHTAVLGQEGYLPYWPCVGILSLFTVFFAWLGIIRIKKRLDFI